MRRFFTRDRKIVDREELAEKLKDRGGRKIVFTNGCFDVVHIGHLRCLQAARSLGDLLIVGVNTDASVRQLKGPERPLNGEEQRTELLSGFECVDYVVLFGEPTARETISLLKPDVWCKGGDYKPDEMPETPTVREYGGRVVVIPMSVTEAESWSTTAIIEKARQRKQ
ncbi:MAG: adenylyltransferase/cytidyltransferase family protein [Abditibacteriota bacterium]|nr:adenylyltransferase/cytidyltransferase family protein [Abditibacteriota bacterium]